MNSNAQAAEWILRRWFLLGEKMRFAASTAAARMS